MMNDASEQHHSAQRYAQGVSRAQRRREEMLRALAQRTDEALLPRGQALFKALFMAKPRRKKMTRRQEVRHR